jgi:serine/threonine protein kinase
MRTVTGTLSYRAPEILMRVAYDEKVDIWGAGLVLYTLLTGEDLFTDDHIPRLVQAISEFNPDSLQGKLDADHHFK